MRELRLESQPGPSPREALLLLDEECRRQTAARTEPDADAFFRSQTQGAQQTAELYARHVAELRDREKGRGGHVCALTLTNLQAFSAPPPANAQRVGAARTRALQPARRQTERRHHPYHVAGGVAPPPPQEQKPFHAAAPFPYTGLPFHVMAPHPPTNTAPVFPLGYCSAPSLPFAYNGHAQPPTSNYRMSQCIPPAAATAAGGGARQQLVAPTPSPLHPPPAAAAGVGVSASPYAQAPQHALQAYGHGAEMRPLMQRPLAAPDGAHSFYHGAGYDKTLDIYLPSEGDSGYTHGFDLWPQ